MTQLDAKTNVDIAMATKDDGAAMKTIAIVTMLFLPATFVSALLGMNFFNFDPDEHGGHMTYSHDLWIYFVVSVVLTLGLFALWWIWQRYRQKFLARSRLEQSDAMENAYAMLEQPGICSVRCRKRGTPTSLLARMACTKCCSNS